MAEVAKSDLRRLMEDLRRDATEYFQYVSANIKPEENIHWYPRREPDFYWSQASDASISRARELADRVLRYTAQAAAAMRGAPLVGLEDLSDLRQSAKTMRATLRFRRYRFHDVEVINDEDRVLGVRSATQSDDECLPPLEADALFHDHASQIIQTIKLIEASADLAPSGVEGSNPPPTSNYRPGTAFIMMWMDPSLPELADVVDCVKGSFRQFGINAVRADDIEHDGQITQRVLNETRTAEFLFADLTGARPNVYYEVGFAHALGRRILLYRKTGTGLHFDLAGYNCPEYANLRDLREKMTKRIESMTNRTPDGGSGDA